ncbi:MAG: 16S rRNA (cytidine(1402)-2'-O)-methyltransferase [Actinobacteria bacterium]|nr:16S rRNA (cytidine(1402)-2'-O)-methyltransferase [Actinomycetota bacterium]
MFICATPIGNLDDCSFRLIKTLTDVDYIIAEDTRTIRKLLARFKISKPAERIISYQDYSSFSKIASILEKLNQGENLALVSESGIPLIQDPGYKIVSASIDEGIPVTFIPGPNAALSALVVSGLPTDSFLFVGFLPKTEIKRKEKIKEVAYLPYTIIFYESPLRLEKLLEELLGIFGDRKACVAREITKLYEETIRGNLSEILAEIKSRKIKGEVVLVVEGYKKEFIKNYSENDIKKEFAKLMAQNISKKAALKNILSRYDIDRQTLYNISTKL